MTGPARPGGRRQRTHQWLPQKVRTRLTLLYAALFLAAGSALLGVTYWLVATSLPVRSAPLPATAAQRAKLQAACRRPNPDLGTIASCKKLNAAFQLQATCRRRDLSPGTIVRCKELYTEFQAGSVTQRDRALRNLLRYSLAGLVAMTVASGGLGWMMAGRVLRPVRRITEAARRASQEHLGERLALSGPRDELKELGDTFDEMLERLDEAFASQRRFAANASHELRTPLTIMRTAIDVTLAKPGRTSQQLQDMGVRVRRTIDRAENMIEALLTLSFSDAEPIGAEIVDLATAAQDAIDDAAALIGKLGLQVSAELAPAGVTGDRRLLERMVSNLVDNAVRHNEPGGWIRIATSSADGTASVQVANSGPVIAPDTVPLLFEPFCRNGDRADSSDGAGLGLSIARAVATAHGARITAVSQPAGGLEVSVVLPRPSGSAVA